MYIEITKSNLKKAPTLLIIILMKIGNLRNKTKGKLNKIKKFT